MASTAATTTTAPAADAKGVLILGSGLSCRPGVHYLAAAGFRVFNGSRTLAKAEALCAGTTATPLAIDVETDAGMDAFKALLPKVDLVVSMLPYLLHALVARTALEAKKHFVTTSYRSDAMNEVAPLAEANGVVMINECGVDPGTDHMSAMRVVHGVRARGGHITSFTSFCGGLPAPDANDNPWGYKFSWAPRGVLLAARNAAKWYENGEVCERAGAALFDSAQRYTVDGVGELEGHANRNSCPYREVYGITRATTVLRGTFRNRGWCAAMRRLVDLDYLSLDARTFSGSTTYAELTRELAERRCADAKGAESARAAVAKATDATDAVLDMIEWLGVFDDKLCVPASTPTVLDALSARFAARMVYADGERDMIAMQHEFLASFDDGHRERITSSLIEYGVPRGDTAMSRTVAIPYAIACKLILTGKFTKPGLSIPIVPELYTPILDELERDHNIKFVDRYTKIDDGDEKKQ